MFGQCLEMLNNTWLDSIKLKKRVKVHNKLGTRYELKYHSDKCVDIDAYRVNLVEEIITSSVIVLTRPQCFFSLLHPHPTLTFFQPNSNLRLLLDIFICCHLFRQLQLKPDSNYPQPKSQPQQIILLIESSKLRHSVNTRLDDVQWNV